MLTGHMIHIKCVCSRLMSIILYGQILISKMTSFVKILFLNKLSSSLKIMYGSLLDLFSLFKLILFQVILCGNVTRTPSQTDFTNSIFINFFFYISHRQKFRYTF